MKWTPAEDKLLVELRASHKLSYRTIAPHFPNRTLTAIKNRYERLALNRPADDASPLEALVADKVITLDDLLAQAQVDLEMYEVERFIINKWEVGGRLVESELSFKDGVRQGYINEKGFITKPLWQVKAWFKPKDRTVQTLTRLRKLVVDDVRAEVKAGQPVTVFRTHNKKQPWLFEFAPFDLHMGKYCWDEETVTDYDTEIAEGLFNASLDFLLERALKLSDGKIDRILFPVGNDVSHVDSKRGETTAGTHMDYDTRYIRVFRRICATHRRAVDILTQVAPVDIKVVPGNHDELTAFHLGDHLGARYEDNTRVTIDNGAKLRKYYEYGVNLFGFTHGDKEKVNELPLLMAREVPDLWARCPSREWHIGHKHIAEKKTWSEMPGVQDLFSDKGVRVRRLMSMTAHDAWHTNNAYTDRRACDAFLFHKQAGFTDHLSFNIDHFTGKAVSK